MLPTRRAARDFNPSVLLDVSFWIAVLSGEAEGLFALEQPESNDLARFAPTVLLSPRTPTISFNGAAFGDEARPDLEIEDDLAIATSIRGFFAIMRASQELSGVPFREAHRTTAMAPMMSRRMSRLPIFDVFPSLCLPPVDFCCGTRPSQEAKSRPRLNVSIGGAKVSIARAPIGPMPGMARNRRGISASLDNASILFFSASIRSVSRHI